MYFCDGCGECYGADAAAAIPMLMVVLVESLVVLSIPFHPVLHPTSLYFPPQTPTSPLPNQYRLPSTHRPIGHNIQTRI